MNCRAVHSLMVGLAFVIAAACPALAAESKNYVYKDFDVRTDRVLETELKSITVEDDGTTHVHHTIQGDEENQDEVYTLDGGLATQSWSVRDAAESLNYTGIRRGNTLYLKGRLKNGPVERELAVDAAPVCNHPKVNLSRFALSDLQKGECWGIRKSTLDAYKMTFKKLGEQTIDFQGRPLETVKVHFSPKNIVFEKFYQQTYYFRKSDGLFIKSEPFNGRAMELVTEEEMRTVKSSSSALNPPR
ncbi:MAG: hypothetical protein KC897_01215 [Candidatus Omnitrophica bacterium]|nr:hypothetical protein [Candidatus Omnitrophota bacterium]MCB9720102.1 hypothetical protein [Candidatus Omnitrophota bacterium]